MDLLQSADQALKSWILKITVGTLAAIVLVVVAVLMIGVFLPNDQVDNKDIFTIIGPAFNTVIGAFVGLLGGMQLAKLGEKTDEKPAEPVAPPEPPKVEEDDGIDHSQPIPEEEHKDDNRWSDDHHEEHLSDHVAKHS